MSDDKDEVDGSDWLSSQFNPTDQVPKQTRRHPVAPPPNAEPVFGTAPTRKIPAPAVPPASAPLPATSAPLTPPAAPAALPPAQNAAGGFNWGLRPGGASDGAAAAPPASATPTPVPAAAAAPPPLVSPPAPAPPPTAPYVPSVPTPAPASEPTQPLSWDEFAATQSPTETAGPAATPATYVDQPTQAFTVPPWQPAAAPTGSAAPAAHDNYRDHSGESTSAIDSLFGDHQFQEYEEVGVLKAVQAPPVAGARSANRPPRAPLAKSQKVLMGVAGGLIGLLLLFGLYVIGEHLGAASAAQAAAAAAATGTKTSSPTPAGSGGPAAPGVQQWSALQGGECIQPFTSAWAVTFTVVPCTSDHDAQMVFKGRLPDADNTGYPSTSDFQTELTALCSAPTAIHYKAASAITDLQISFSYPPSSASWIAGNRTYYCFVDRASGGALPADLSVPTTTN